MVEHSFKTLVVEDDPVARSLLQDILMSRGHDVEACADAETAWAMAQRDHFALAFLDIRLPGMTGTELCRRIRKLSRGQESVIVFVTGVDDRQELEAALAAGGDDYILKPLVGESLHIRVALGERHVHRIQKRREAEERMEADALRDPVTDLVNRTLFMERLRRTARRATRESRKPGRQGGYLYSVVSVNIDGFARINQRYGYDGGDEVLGEMGRRLEDCVRAIDTVARYDADEFLLLLDNLSDVSDPTRVTRRIHTSLLEPFEINGQSEQLSACIGIAINLTGQEDPNQLLGDARKALLRAKSTGPGTQEMFDAVMHARAMARLQLEGRLRSAVDDGEMVLYYQPILSTAGQRIVGFEALVRWDDPERGIVMPEEFIHVAEDTGVITRLGWWTLDVACAQLREWQETFPSDPPLSISVNVSARQFAHEDVASRIDEAVVRSGIPPESLHLEITETALMTDLTATDRVMRKIDEDSVRLHVDDFGTGYSSLSYLCRFPIDALKIDRSFVTDMLHSSENREVVHTIVRLARNLGISVIAEGVETERQLQELEKLACDQVQGFLFSRAVPPEDVPSLLARYQGGA